jgi:hypothetical protein
MQGRVVMTLSEAPSRTVLEETPARVLTFLRALGTSIPVRAKLASAGYTPADHTEGWNLLHKVSGYMPDEGSSEEDPRVQNAIAELDAWDERGFRRAHAALARLHPDQDRFVFNGLTPAQGPEAVLRVALFLDRLDALEQGTSRKGTRDADRAALATLAARGFGPEERARLREVVNVAHASPVPSEAAVNAAKMAVARGQALVDLRRWFDDWSETARAVVTRRDHQIRLGIAHRKKKPAKPVPTNRPNVTPPPGNGALVTT